MYHFTTISINRWTTLSVLCEYIDTDVYIGFDDNIDYTQNVDNVYLQPVSVVENSGTWYTTGFGNDVLTGFQ